jgi:transcriptional regulator with XRE-family HTH domain
MPSAAKIRQLRSTIKKTQREFAAIAACSPDTIESIELGRMKLSARLAARISRACGVDPDWLLNDDEEPMRNEYGESWTLRDFEECQERDETLAFYLAEEEMEIAVAYGLLLRVYRESRAIHAVPKFRDELERFVQKQVGQFPHLKTQVEKENATRDKRQQRVRSYLFPAGTEDFKRSREKLNAAISAFADWENRMASRKR